MGIIEKSCEICGKQYFVSPARVKKSRFCSKKCDAVFRTKRIGKLGANWKGGKTERVCIACGKKFSRYPNEKSKCCSSKCAGIVRITRVAVNCRGCGKGMMVIPSWLKQGRQYCSQTCYRRNQIKPNTIESAVQDALRKNGVYFIPEYPVGLYHIDIFIPSSNLAVECDGDYWHKGREAHDAKREKAINKAGISVIRFKEIEIRKSLDSCIDKILHLINTL